MKSFYLPLALTVGGGVLYHLSQKSISRTVNPLHTMIFAYLAAICICGIASLFYSGDRSFLASVKDIKLPVIAVGLGAAAIELGFLFAYRAGWNISLAAVTSSVAVSLLLIPIGLTMYREHLTPRHAVGLALCLLGLILVARK